MNTASMLIHSIGWAIVYSLWQGAIIYLLLKMILLAYPNMRAKIRYHLEYVSLLSLLTCFCANIYTEWQRLQAITIKVTESGTDPSGAKVFFIKTLPQQHGYLNEGFAMQVEHFFPFLIVLYVLGILFFSLRFIINLAVVQRLKRKSAFIPSQSLQDRFENIKKMMGIHRSIKLRLTNKLNMPVVFGTIKPVILLPVASVNQLTTDQLEAILLHELAHIRRYDYLLNILQTVAETILFFNPFTWLLSSLIRREREHCCDDLVLSHTSHPLPYAKALATLETHRQHSGSFAMAAAGKPNHLFNRIKRIMEMKKHSVNYSHLTIAFILIATLIVSVVWLTPAIAQGKKEKKGKQKSEQTADEKTKITKTQKIIIIDDEGNRTEYHDVEDLPPALKKTISLSVTAADDALKITDDVLKNIDVAAITKEVTKTLKEVDISEVTAEVDKAVKEIDWNEINKEIENAMIEVRKELNDPKLKDEVKISLRKAQHEIERASADAKKDKAKARRELAMANREIAIAQKKAANTEKVIAVAGNTKAFTNSYDKMLNEMEREGLIRKNKGFEIKKYQDKLYIDGKEQPGEVYKKYRKYLDGDVITLRGDDDNISINVRK